MARPRTPTAILSHEGAFRKNPARGRKRDVEPRALAQIEPPYKFLNPPDYEPAKRWLAIWQETLEICWWLTAAEAGPLESYCLLKDKERRNLAKGSDLANLLRLYTTLGMTQEGRAKFTGRRPKKGAGKEVQFDLGALKQKLVERAMNDDRSDSTSSAIFLLKSFGGIRDQIALCNPDGSPLEVKSVIVDL